MPNNKQNEYYFSEDERKKIAKYLKNIDSKLKPGFRKQWDSYVNRIDEVFYSEANKKSINISPNDHLKRISIHLKRLIKDLKSKEAESLLYSIDKKYIPIIFNKRTIDADELKNTMSQGDAELFIIGKIAKYVRKNEILKKPFTTTYLIVCLEIYQEAVEDILKGLSNKTGKKRRSDIKSLEIKIQQLALIYKKAGGKLTASTGSELVVFIQYMLDLEQRHKSNNTDKMYNYEEAIQRIIKKINGG